MNLRATRARRVITRTLLLLFNGRETRALIARGQLERPLRTKLINDLIHTRLFPVGLYIRGL